MLLNDVNRAKLFLGPLDPGVKVEAAGAVACRKLGLRYRMAVVPLDPVPVRGSHGRLPERPEDGPVLLCSRPGEVSGTLPATEVTSLLLRLAGLT